MTIIAISPSSILPKGQPDHGVINSLKTLSKLYPTYVISNHGEPAWFSSTFNSYPIEYIREQGRQDGEVIKNIANNNNQKSYEAIVIASSEEDLQMGKNGGAVVLTATWMAAARLKDLGIPVDNATDLTNTIHLIDMWEGDWWFEYIGDKYSILSLANLSSYYVPQAQQHFAKKITGAVKQGGYALPALLAVTCKSLLKSGISSTDSLFWAVYPSSQSNNDDTEILSDFTHSLRTTLSRVHFAKRDKPLFFRHTSSRKRSAGGATNRLDPTDQITTIHLNPYYKERIKNRNVIIIDDCTTYGLSFGVASSFLLAAGAKSVTGIALGKFGNQLHHFDIEILSNPFQPAGLNDFRKNSCQSVQGSTNDNMDELMRLIGSHW